MFYSPGPTPPSVIGEEQSFREDLWASYHHKIYVKNAKSQINSKSLRTRATVEALPAKLALLGEADYTLCGLGRGACDRSLRSKPVQPLRAGGHPGDLKRIYCSDLEFPVRMLLHVRGYVTSPRVKRPVRQTCLAGRADQNNMQNQDRKSLVLQIFFTYFIIARAM
jgi:hypothetical protein